MKALELLAPARNTDIGIAAIDCGADAVYIAGPRFGARKDAGNSLEDIAALCSYAHRFGARIFLTVNTIIYEPELPEAKRTMLAAQEAGVDAFIVQDLALSRVEGITVPIHASTQCAIRSLEKARYFESLGFGRIVLERQLSLEEIAKIARGVACETEAFVHGALCVCYSGQCYLSSALTGRSANRGECAQACRSLYDLKDAGGKVLARDKALLSLKDLDLSRRLEELAEAGVCSFKVEGRLKNISYVRNVVRAYSKALDALVAKYPDRYCRASFGRVAAGFEPTLSKTFNRGYTELFLDGKKGKWAAMDTPRSVGEKIGTVASVAHKGERGMEIRISPASKDISLSNGDGFAVVVKGGITGFRADVCEGWTIRCKSIPGIARGQEVFRNIDTAFEREMERNACKRELRVDLELCVSGNFKLDFTARCEDGRVVADSFNADLEAAENTLRSEDMMRSQLSKRSSDFSFTLTRLEVRTPGGRLPLLSASTLNSMRRLIASDLDGLTPGKIALCQGKRSEYPLPFPEEKNYKANVANPEAEKMLGDVSETAFELRQRKGAELMRSRYCLRYELGLCSVRQGAKDPGPLFLENNGRRFSLGFDCKNCEMTVSEAD